MVDPFSGLELELCLAQYVVSFKESARDSLMFGIACDKGTVHRLPLHDGVIFTPGGRGAVCNPVVHALSLFHVNTLFPIVMLSPLNGTYPPGPAMVYPICGVHLIRMFYNVFNHPNTTTYTYTPAAS